MYFPFTRAKVIQSTRGISHSRIITTVRESVNLSASRAIFAFVVTPLPIERSSSSRVRIARVPELRESRGFPGCPLKVQLGLPRPLFHQRKKSLETTWSLEACCAALRRKRVELVKGRSKRLRSTINRNNWVNVSRDAGQRNDPRRNCVTAFEIGTAIAITSEKAKANSACARR